MKAKITKRIVDSLSPGILWDTELNGFGVRHRGQGCHYLLKYSLHGQQRWYTIGRHGSPWTPDQARQEARRLLGLVSQGYDPQTDKQAARKEMAVAELCELYLAEGTTTQKLSTIKSDEGRIKRHIIPLLGSRKISSVNKGHVRTLLHDIAAGKTASDVKTGFRGRAIVTGGEGVANRTVALLGSIFSLAMDRGMIPYNPVHGVKKFKTKKCDRFLSEKEMAMLGDTLAEADRIGVLNRAGIAAVRLLLLTGCRKTEILSLEWSFVDFNHNCLRLPDSKTGQKTVPLGPPALELLASIPQGASRFVLPSTKGNGHFIGLQKVWNAIRTKAELEDVRIHDLRHSFASVAVAGGSSLFLVGKVLGHARAATTERYAHLADDPLKAVADHASRHIAGALKGNSGETCEVITLPQETRHG